MAYTPSWFAAQISSVTAAPVSATAGQQVVVAGPLCVRLAVAPGTDVAVSRDGAVTLVLHGDLVSPRPGITAVDLLAWYLARGLAWVAELDGSYAPLIIDGRDGTVVTVTDRLGSRRVYGGRCDGGYGLASSLGLLPWEDETLDRTALAGYLVNGVVHNNRTLLAGVRVLKRACVHRVGPSGAEATPYWAYVFDDSARDTPVEELQRELAALVVEAVRRRLPASGALYLSLSAGYDATGILGALGFALQVPGVRCVSYSLGGDHPDDDAVISRAMAAVAGYEHRVIPSYTGDLLQVLAHNVALGQGQAHFCDEVQYWTTIGPELQAEAGALFVGDQAFGFTTPAPPRSYAEVLRKVYIASFADLPVLAAWLPAPLFRELSEAWGAELERIVATCPASAQLEDVRDYLYLDQRVSHLILPWRERFAGTWALVRFPLLDRTILDFNRRLPPELRRSKALWKATRRSSYPDLFTQPRGRSRYQPAWSEEYARAAPALAALIDAHDSPLDALIPPELLLGLLDAHSNTHRAAGSLPARARWLAEKALGRLRRSLGQAPGARSQPEGPQHALLLQRLLVLREYLRQRAAHASRPVAYIHGDADDV